jgi:hypothetical protein
MLGSQLPPNFAGVNSDDDSIRLPVENVIRAYMLYLARRVHTLDRTRP